MRGSRSTPHLPVAAGRLGAAPQQARCHSCRPQRLQARGGQARWPRVLVRACAAAPHPRCPHPAPGSSTANVRRCAQNFGVSVKLLSPQTQHQVRLSTQQGCQAPGRARMDHGQDAQRRGEMPGGRRCPRTSSGRRPRAWRRTPPGPTSRLPLSCRHSRSWFTRSWSSFRSPAQQ